MTRKYLSTHEQFKNNHRVNEEGVTERKCTGECQQWLEENYTNYYYKNKSYPERGFSPECKKCSTERTRKNTEKKHDKVVAYILDYQQGKGKEKSRERWSRLGKKNRKRKRQHVKDFFKRHPEKGNEYWLKRKPKVHKVSIREWEQCKKYFIHRCAYCGLPIEEHYYTRNGITKLGDFHKEHVIDEGRNDLKNCIPSCSTCNDEKNIKTLNEWYNINNPKYNIERYLRIYQWFRYDCKKYIEQKKNKQKKLA